MTAVTAVGGRGVTPAYIVGMAAAAVAAILKVDCDDVLASNGLRRHPLDASGSGGGAPVPAPTDGSVD